MLATEQQWCKGRLRDAHGRHCLVGAIEAVGGRQVLQKPILQAAREVSGKRYWRIEFFNDDPRTTHADVLQVLRRTRENMIDGMICSFDRQPRHRRWIRTLRALCSRGDLDAEAISPESTAGFLPANQLPCAAHRKPADRPTASLNSSAAAVGGSCGSAFEEEIAAAEPCFSGSDTALIADVRRQQWATKMHNLWSDRDAERLVAHYAAAGVGRDLALRVYTSRLLGGDRGWCCTAAATPRSRP